jgi:cysteine sulfinate desulfinase/cysteine desulfurase-like protein/rhodanese-related sulfurtransferase
MEIYLDANATTPVLPAARDAALAAMGDAFGNPSSTHSAGLKARAVIDAVRERARRVLGAPSGQLLFLSGATEGIQTAVLSALSHLKRQGRTDEGEPGLLLYGATEHKAVPEALKHWNDLLGLHLQVLPIPVGRDGRHDLPWLRARASRARLVCTMAANNETGVVSDLDGIASALAGSPALWLVDGVQALGKLALRLGERRIDYAPFSGHKLYAPKGIGMLYVREGAPFTPLMAGGGQEGALRSGTENMAGIAALGAVLAALEEGGTFRDSATLHGFRDRLAQALSEAFPGLVFNAPPALCLPTTLNFAVPGLSSKVLLNLFDAAGIRVSGGSACSAAKAQPSHVLQAMGLPEGQTTSAVRLSFGPAEDAALIEEACARIRACGESLRACGASPEPGTSAFVEACAVDVPVDLAPAAVAELVRAHPDLRVVDVREPYEQRLGAVPRFGTTASPLAMPLSRLPDALPGLLGLPDDAPVLFVCRSGHRSAQAARALRRLGHEQAWSLRGGLALWPGVAQADAITMR